MTRLFLAAGVAALAISMPASAKPGGGNGGGDRAQAEKARGGDRAQRVERAPRAQSTQRVERRQSVERAPRFANVQQRQERRVERVRPQRAERFQSVQRQERRIERVRPQRAERIENRGAERRQLRANRIEQVRNRGVERRMERQVMRDNRIERGPRQAVREMRLDRGQDRKFARNELRANRVDLARNHDVLRNELRTNRIERLGSGAFIRDARFGPRTLRPEDFGDRVQGWGAGGCPPGLASKGCMPPGQAAKLLGTPLSTAARFASFNDVPSSFRYLYPDTDDYYYRFGDGYAYRVDRDDSLISALLPLAFGGYMPGSYLPNSYMSSPNYYMNSYMPAAYGFNSFYPDYGNDCHRYGYGVVYDVDCQTGFVEDAIPLYAGGYGVGQYLPSGYGYYNVPNQYRSMYYDTPDYNYWYAPGAIYQYDPSSSLITSVAALLSPGFSVGQQLPMGYDVYNVPYDYRQTYYDTPNAWYRYNNGNIYQVDPTTQLITAIVASILT